MGAEFNGLTALVAESENWMGGIRPGPERNLLMSLLITAITDLNSDLSGAHLIRKNAMNWFLSAEDHPCTFEWTCYALGLNAASIREALVTKSTQAYRPKVRLVAVNPRALKYRRV